MPGGRPARSYSQAQRLLKLVEMLQHRGQLTIAEMMDEFGIDRRTVQRDMAELSMLFALEEGERTAENSKTFRLTSSSRTETLKVTVSEMVALYTSKHLFGFLQGTDLMKAMDTLYEKLQTRLTAANAQLRDTLPKKLYCTVGFPKRYRSKDDVLNAVLSALLHEEKLAVRYQPPGNEPYDDVMHPYTFLLHGQALYLIGHSERASALRTLALDRMRKATWKREEGFDYPEGYDPAQVLAGAFGVSGGEPVTVRLRFVPAVAPYVAERRWHSSMKSKRRRDGSLEVELRVAVGHELVHWITGYGPDVAVLAPSSLRREIEARHRTAGRGHRS